MKQRRIYKQTRTRGRERFENTGIQGNMRNRGEDQEILVSDGIGGDHVIKYLDEDRVIVQKVMRYKKSGDQEVSAEHIRYSKAGLVRLNELHDWPYTERLKNQITAFHDQCRAHARALSPRA